jgi:hypothetical protein
MDFRAFFIALGPRDQPRRSNPDRDQRLSGTPNNRALPVRL